MVLYSSKWIEETPEKSEERPLKMPKRTEYELALECAIDNATKLAVSIGLFLSYISVFYGYSIAMSFFLGLLAICVWTPILILASVVWVSLM